MTTNRQLEIDCFKEAARWVLDVLATTGNQIVNREDILPKAREAIVGILAHLHVEIEDNIDIEANRRYRNSVSDEEMKRDRNAGLPYLHPDRNK